MVNKVAVVTGSNRGIGYAIVRELCKRGVGTVYLTARDEKKGKQAIEKLQKEGFNPTFLQLDVQNRNSIKAAADQLKKNNEGIDILINNAGVIVNDFYNNTYEDAKRVIDINYRSVLTIQEYFFPLLKENSRVINIASDCGHISNLRNEEWIKRLTKEDVTVEDINAFVDWYLESTKNGTLKKEDFAEMEMLSYRISKIALVALTRVQQRQVGKNISVNALHPGFVATDMTRGTGTLTMDEAGRTPAYLALGVDQSVKGKYFWFDRTEKDWTDPTLELYCKFRIFEKYMQVAGQL